MRIEALEIDDEILEGIERQHGVALYEVEEVCFSQRRHVRRGREGLYQVFGRSEAGRHVFVVLASGSASVWRVVTARKMTDRERRLYDRHVGG